MNKSNQSNLVDIRESVSKLNGTIRCAIYTRKSTDEGLEQEFNSLDAQRESAEAYIASQRHEGWVCIPDRFDDGGFTGGNMERPALKRLVARIESGDVDCVVVYKVDRLSRSLLDFARMMELFDKHSVTFVSVTQQFNTTSSMGRLTLNILLSFAPSCTNLGSHKRPRFFRTKSFKMEPVLDRSRSHETPEAAARQSKSLFFVTEGRKAEKAKTFPFATTRKFPSENRPSEFGKENCYAASRY